MDVLEAIDTVSAISPETRIVLLFTRVDEFEIRRACYAGVSGCLLKTDSVRSLRIALGRVLMGSVVCSARIRKHFPAALPFEDAQGGHAH
jgi:DNA-binding NarL/FixJ family response regulator